MNEHLFQFLLVIGGTLLGAGATGAQSLLHRWKKDLIAKGAHEQRETSRDAAIVNEAKERGKLEQRIEKLEGDLNNVATAWGKRLGKLEKKDAALETYVTGKMPRVSGENEALNAKS